MKIMFLVIINLLTIFSFSKGELLDNIEWIKIIGGKNSKSYFNATINKNNEIIIQQRGTPNFVKDTILSLGYISKLNQEGNYIWTKKFDDPFSNGWELWKPFFNVNDFSFIIPFKDSLVIDNKKYSTSKGYNSHLYINSDKNGQINKTFTFCKSPNGWMNTVVNSNKITFDSQKNMYLLINFADDFYLDDKIKYNDWAVIGNYQFDCFHFCLVKYNSNGNLEWSKHLFSQWYWTTVGYCQQLWTNIQVIDDNLYLINGNYNKFSTDLKKIYSSHYQYGYSIFKFDKNNGDILDTFHLGGFELFNDYKKYEIFPGNRFNIQKDFIYGMGDLYNKMYIGDSLLATEDTIHIYYKNKNFFFYKYDIKKKGI